MTFILTNGQGGFSYLTEKPSSKYEGVFFYQNGKMFKTIANLHFHEPEHDSANLLWGAERTREDKNETLFMPDGHNALILEISKPSEFLVQLDCKEITDNREWGRDYKITTKDKTIIVHYSKKNDEREEKGDEYTIYMAVTGDMHMMPMERWDPLSFGFDRRRHSPPYQRWVYSAFKLKGKKFSFGFGLTEEDAILQSKQAYKNSSQLQESKENHIESIVVERKKYTPMTIAYNCCLASLNSLLVEQEWLMAGLPWFYHRWKRDELISSKALMKISPALRKKTLLYYLHSNGWASNNESELAAVDAPLWLFFRIQDLIPTLNPAERSLVLKHLTSYLDFIKLEDGLLHNNSKETWMDTTWQDKDGRNGARIEIQCLLLSACKTYTLLIGKNHHLEAEVKSAVLKHFWNSKYLKDGSADNTIRPNVFIACYAYPELLSKKEWTTCFKNCLSELWLPWGGLSSISQKNSLFTAEYTGETNQSYHRGDSWYWVNNLAALVMHKIDAVEFQKEIKAIAEASSRDILELGASGHHSEVSSAKEQTADGCQAQAWSAAMFIELIDEIAKD